MKRLLLMVGFVSICAVVTAQSFEVSGLQESYKGSIGNIIHAPLHFKNTTEKPIVLIIRRTETQIGTSQKSLFCYDNNCFEARSEDYVLRIEPGQTIKNFSIGLEAGLTEGFSNMNYVIFNKFLWYACATRSGKSITVAHSGGHCWQAGPDQAGRSTGEHGVFPVKPEPIERPPGITSPVGRSRSSRIMAKENVD
jgi:hypothetical protein